MALGISFGGGGGGGDIIPIVKYDARAGRMFRRDRADGVNNDVDITRSFKAVLDFENLEVGWVNFPMGAAPDFVLARYGDPIPPRPSDAHKTGARILIKLSSDCGGDVRELSSSAGVFLGGLDRLHDAYLAGSQANPGKLPVVVLKDTTPITSGGAQKSTNYEPIFEIVSWVARPADLQAKPRARASTPAAATPPATGSTRVDPPARAPAMAYDDFG